jgi:hypothetical protein
MNIQGKHHCKGGCGGYLHGGPCSYLVEGGLGEPVALYCVKSAHRENLFREGDSTNPTHSSAATTAANK